MQGPAVCNCGPESIDSCIVAKLAPFISKQQKACDNSWRTCVDEEESTLVHCFDADSDKPTINFETPRIQRFYPYYYNNWRFNAHFPIWPTVNLWIGTGKQAALLTDIYYSDWAPSSHFHVSGTIIKDHNGPLSDRTKRELTLGAIQYIRFVLLRLRCENRYGFDLFEPLDTGRGFAECDYTYWPLKRSLRNLWWPLMHDINTSLNYPNFARKFPEAALAEDGFCTEDDLQTLAKAGRNSSNLSRALRRRLNNQRNSCRFPMLISSVPRAERLNHYCEEHKEQAMKTIVPAQRTMHTYIRYFDKEKQIWYNVNYGFLIERLQQINRKRERRSPPTKVHGEKLIIRLTCVTVETLDEDANPQYKKLPAHRFLTIDPRRN